MDRAFDFTCDLMTCVSPDCLDSGCDLIDQIVDVF